jgi:hypothetical protein
VKHFVQAEVLARCTFHAVSPQSIRSHGVRAALRDAITGDRLDMSQNTYRAYQPRMPVARRAGSMASETHAIVEQAKQPAAVAGVGLVQPHPEVTSQKRDGTPHAVEATAQDLRTAA